MLRIGPVCRGTLPVCRGQEIKCAEIRPVSGENCQFGGGADDQSGWQVCRRTLPVWPASHLIVNLNL